VDSLTAASVALFTSLALLGYTYVGYPALLGLFSLFRRKTVLGSSDPGVWPEVSVIIAAHNEESVIGRRIENLLELDYPPERLHILIGSDGSTDRTSEIVRLYRRARIGFHDFALQRGKAHVLNDLVGQARGKYVIFTDANTFFERTAVKELVRGFRLTPSACAVVGKLEFRTPEGTVNPDSVYWRYETMLKRLESDFGTVLGANGAIYAIRRSWYRPLPPGTIVDDFLVPMLMRLDRGGTVIFRPSAKAWETVPETVRDEFRRRVRIGAGDAHALRHTWRLLLPQYGMLAVSYWSHKIVRWLGPALLVIACVGNIWLLDRPWGRALFLVQLAVYSIGFAAPMLRRLPLIGQMATGVWYFMVLNAALLLGTLKYLAGRATPVWQRTPRTGERIPHLRAYRSHTKPVVESPEQSQEDSPAA
jgi:biofilm PGA synthesis N-glycosyltransferase PgaC